MPSVPAISFDVRPSQALRLAFTVMATLAVVALMLCAAPLALRMAMALLVVGYAACTLKTMKVPKVCKAVWRGDQTWGLKLANGEEAEAQLLTGRVLGSLIVLRLAWEPRRRAALLLLPDNLDADTRRRLRVRLSVQADSV